MLIEFLGQALILGFCMFTSAYAISSKDESEKILKGIPFFVIIIAVIMINCYLGGDLFNGIADKWNNAG